MSNFSKTIDEMKAHGMRLPEKRIQISVADAKGVLYSAFNYFLRMEKREVEWLPEYESIALWLTDNRGDGLFMYGNCGRGKTLLSQYVLPAILLQYCRKVVTVFDVQQMNRDIDLVLSKRIISLDDIGTEEESVKFGERRLAFAEIMDAAEKSNKLMIVTTNLSADQIRQRYGERTFERIKSTTRRVLFTGNSLRR